MLMSKSTILSVFALMLAGCASNQVLSRNPSALPVWSPDLQAKEPFEAPYVSFFAGQGKNLIFQASKHRNSLDDPSYKTVKWTFDNYPIDAVVIEGYSHCEGVNASKVLSRIASASK